MNTNKRAFVNFLLGITGILIISFVVGVTVWRLSQAVMSSETLLGAATVLTAPQGGTGLSSYTRGDLLYATSSNRFQSLAVGTSGQNMTVANGLPAWSSNLLWSSATGTNLVMTGITTTTGGIFPASAGGASIGSSLFPYNTLNSTGTAVIGGALTVTNSSGSGADRLQVGYEQSPAKTAGSGADTYLSTAPLNIYAHSTGFVDAFTMTAGGNGVDGACFSAKNLGTTLGRQCQTSSPLNYWIMSYGGLAFQSGNTTPYNPSTVDFMVRDNKVGIGVGVFVAPNTTLEVAGTTSSTKGIFGRGATSTFSGDELVVIGTDATSTIRGGASGKPRCDVWGDSDGVGLTYCTANDGIQTCSTTPCN